MMNFSRSTVVSAVRNIFFLVPFVTFLPVKALSLELGNTEKVLSVDVHGFVSQGFMVSTDNNYLMESKHGSFEFSEVGLNFTKELNEKMRAGFQLFARKLGAVGNYNIKADWFYLDYRFADEFGLRAGRVKLPFGLYNDTSDIDAARVPILLPQSIYPTSNRDYLLAQTGGELYGRVKLSSAGTLDYRIYGGSVTVALPPQAGNPVQIQDIHNPYVVGGRILWELPVEGLRIGGSMQYLRLDTHVTIDPLPTTAVNFPATLWVASAEYAFNNLLLAAEYSRWYVSGDSQDPTVIPDIPTLVSERAYGMLSYRFNPWLQPGAYYSILYPDMNNRSGRQNQQHDVAATFRFDINPFWLVKLEGHYMKGTAGVDPYLNNYAPLSTLEDDWFVFLIKTTAYF